MLWSESWRKSLHINRPAFPDPGLNILNDSDFYFIYFEWHDTENQQYYLGTVRCNVGSNDIQWILHALLWTMNFIVECSTRYFTSERSERVRYRVEHSKIKFISTSGHVICWAVYYINISEKSVIYYNHNDGDLSTCEDNMLFLRVNI